MNKLIIASAIATLSFSATADIKVTSESRLATIEHSLAQCEAGTRQVFGQDYCEWLTLEMINLQMQVAPTAAGLPTLAPIPTPSLSLANNSGNTPTNGNNEASPTTPPSAIPPVDDVIVAPIAPVVPIGGASWDLSKLNEWIDNNDSKNGETKWDVVWNEDKQKLVWKNPETGQEKDLRDSQRIQEVIENTKDVRQQRLDQRQDDRRSDDVNNIEHFNAMMEKAGIDVHYTNGYLNINGKAYDLNKVGGDNDQNSAKTALRNEVKGEAGKQRRAERKQSRRENASHSSRANSKNVGHKTRSNVRNSTSKRRNNQKA